MIITSFDPFTITSNGYDLLETGSENPSSAALWLRKKTADFEAKARTYFAEKKRTKYYTFTGYFENLDRDMSYLFPLTDEQVERIRQLFMEIYRSQFLKCGYKPEKIASTFEEVMEDEENPFEGMMGVNSELDELVFDPLADLDFAMELKHIDLQHPGYLYDVTIVDYEAPCRESLVPIKKKVKLTDDEYLYLLTQRLLYDGFTFNRLILYKPELAQKIIHQLDDLDGNGVLERGCPYLVAFDEVNADAETILQK